MTTSRTEPPRRAAVVGTGLIGGSVGLALRAAGWHVTGTDADPAVAERARSLGAVDDVGEDPTADLVVVATPVHVAAPLIRRALGDGADGPVVTDVGSVKGPLVAQVDHPRFVGGHPMAGSEQVGLDGADAGLFVGATWVLTPTGRTDPDAYALVRTVLADLGADIVALAPDRHDELVAMVSHVPHLTAATLMTLASELGEEHAAVLKLAAGGFRDMTRIAAGQPTIWPGICEDNAEAIVATLDRLIDGLTAMRRRVADRDHGSLLAVLNRAAVARRALGVAAPAGAPRAEVRVPVLDRPGEITPLLTLATDLDVNLHDLEIAHSVEGDRGVLVLTVDAAAAAGLVAAYQERGRPASWTPLGDDR